MSSDFRDGDVPRAAKSLLSGISESGIPEDSIHYWIYPVGEDSSTIEDLLSFACDLSKDYIWHNESFRLQSKALPCEHFFGSTLFDENIEDEWFVVHILMEITRRFPQLVTKVQDCDGELLLIEAADFLPEWLNPESAENRVFIHQGKVHIIPPANHQLPSISSPKIAIPEKITDAKTGAHFVAEYPAITLASAEIQAAIAARLQAFSGAGCQNWHRANCLVAPKIARILKEKPKLVADATRAFYLRDAFDLKACREMKHFKPSTSSEDMILTSVRFSKHLFAMIRGQKFHPDKRSGWLELVNAVSKNVLGSYKAMDLGVKITCGFEILCNRAETSRRLKKANHVLSPIYEFADSDTRWQAFFLSLKKNGYFRGELQGSKLHSELLTQAKSFFETALLGDESAGVDPCLEVIRMIQQDLTRLELAALKQEQATLPKEDDESWLNVTAADLDSEISRPESATNGFSFQDADDEEEEDGDDFGSTALGALAAGLSSPKKQKLRKKSRERSNLGSATAAAGDLGRDKELGERVREWVEKGSGPAAEGADEPKLVTPKKSRSEAKGASTGNDPCARSIQRMIDLNLDHHGMEGADQDSSDMDSYDEDELKIDLSEVGATKQMKEWGMNLREYMQTMDKELAGTSMAKSFFKNPKPPPRAKSKSPAADSIDLEDDDFRPVNIDKNLVTNMLESYWSETKPGPASALLHTLKLRPPRERAELDSDDFEEEFAGEDDDDRK